MLDNTHTTHPANGPVDGLDPDLTLEDLGLPGRRVTILWWASFDRPIVLTALALAAGMLAVWATPIPVRLIGLFIAVTSLQLGVRLWIRELRTPASQRGCDVIDGQPGRGRHSC
jgi:hypothetical protein